MSSGRSWRRLERGGLRSSRWQCIDPGRTLGVLTMRIHIGTSGYNYPEWRGTFYPADLKTKDMFAFYRERFRTVEINATFYRMPTPKTTEGWLAQATPGFTYALKAPRRITHDQRLKACDAHVQFFATSARVLGDHLGPLLFQLPPNFKSDVPR